MTLPKVCTICGRRPPLAVRLLSPFVPNGTHTCLLGYNAGSYGCLQLPEHVLVPKNSIIIIVIIIINIIILFFSQEQEEKKSVQLKFCLES